ncbi:hypothetical protein TNCV_425831 [Trichonephila clavipes]|uniref:Uncharacterized protein n=1 Tax=Trichonephila inaurata madagascariensis TaxID=2747483 RepID=A0A8X6XHC2_9ARAC|nr:hypothetical protein TNCV_425831 [Trichonephila clavipes]GFY52454.1 hypothetical protein TNIN_376551 [Trichonephila inaurata madagascariensis]GFY77076.1 hypothetical protein TNIN_15801 [Trichonephila inaurata madagascariensis]
MARRDERQMEPHPIPCCLEAGALVEETGSSLVSVSPPRRMGKRNKGAGVYFRNGYRENGERCTLERRLLFCC